MKTYKVVYAPHFIESLLEIKSYLSEENPIAARILIDGILKRCDSFSLFPKEGKLRPELGARLRSIHYGHFSILYTVNDKAEIVEFKHIFRSSRNIDILLKDN
ncbi:type II toxin-antitoxin system RelE/ParE family toxin [Candidatus Saccharibacteria bacterium]|nr:type II toxin-antitoxin system RelE/ParE family toxin [Candidatus Saccharibacteria bacterium]